MLIIAVVRRLDDAVVPLVVEKELPNVRQSARVRVKGSGGVNIINIILISTREHNKIPIVKCPPPSVDHDVHMYCPSCVEARVHGA